MRNIVITGGAGFIGSHVVERVVEEYTDANIVILDKMTYAADIANIEHFLVRGKRRLVVGDICDFDLCCRVTRDVDCVINLAAESHVDNSFGNSLKFTLSNTLGTHTLLEAARVNKVPLFLHISTDEVYGEIKSGSFSEVDILNPTNPYAASKASADMLVNSYRHSFNMPIITVRANNMFGIRQFPEKIIPKFSMLLLSNQKMTIHGNGLNRRHYLAVEDFANAIIALIRKGMPGEIYNIGSDEEYSNMDVAAMIAANLKLNVDDHLIFIEDRPFNDFRYSIDSEKLGALGWHPSRSLKNEIGPIIDWYRENHYRYAGQFEIGPTRDSAILVR